MKYICLLFTYTLITTPVFAAPCVDMTPAMAAMTQQQITINNNSSRDIQFDVLVADNNSERAAGFQHICPHVIKKRLILFAYPQQQEGLFHMHNVHAPLDIAFFDKTGQLIAVQQMQTYTTKDKPLYGPETPFQFALEAAIGFFDRHLISAENSHLKIEP